MPTRREILASAGAALAVGAVPTLPDALATPSPTDARANAWARNGVERDVPALEMEGRWPAELSGVFHRDGPARHELAGLRYRHWFDGDGMIQAWRVRPDGTASHRSRYVRTRKREAEERAGRALVPTFATVPPGAERALPPPAINPANISVLPLAGALYALWEAGPAWEIDPDTLATVGEKAWRPDLAGMPFSAHPKIAPDGTVWNFGVGYPDGRMLIWRIGADGNLDRAVPLDIHHPGMLHDVALTERSLVFMLSPFTLTPERLADTSFLDAHRWHGNRPLVIVAVDRDDPSRVRRWEAPAGFGFHFGNAWEETDGTIRLTFTLADDPGIVTDRLASVMAGRVAPSAPLRLTAFTLRPGGRVETAPLTAGESEFPRIDPRRVGVRSDAVFHLERRSGPFWFDTLVRRDGDGAIRGAFTVPDGWTPEEHLFVPRAADAPEGNGWLIGTAIDVVRGRQGLCAYDAERLGDGPLAVAWMDGFHPPALHGAFSRG